MYKATEEKNRLSAIFKDSTISFHSALTRFLLPGKNDLQTYFVFKLLHLSQSDTELSGYQLFLSDRSQERVDQLDSTRPMLATPVNAVMSLRGVKELVMRADRLEH